jgi:anti-sigma regulatory factor (Ser/Thr protein kinase)
MTSPHTPAPAPLSAELPFQSDAPSIARSYLRQFAAGMLPTPLDDAVLMVSELVTNALVHGRPEITLRLAFEHDRLTVAVGDSGEGRLTCAAPPQNQPSGGGLVVVNALATRWGVSRTRDQVGKQVWFELA